MKRLLGTLLIFLSLYSSAQKNKSHTLQLSSLENEDKPVIPFAGVKIIDARFDKSTIGVVLDKYTFRGVSINKKDALFPDSLTEYLPEIISNIVDWMPEKEDSLVLLVKRFRIADHLNNVDVSGPRPELVCNVSISFFAGRKDGLHKLFTIEDVLARRISDDNIKYVSELSKLRDKVLFKLFCSFFENKNWVASSMAYPSASVAEGIHKRFSLPVLVDSVKRPGIYRSFAEFKDNQPGIVNVKPVTSRGKVVAYKDTDGKYVTIKDYWGCCDGSKCYIVFRNSLYELEPKDKGFRFLSYRDNHDMQNDKSFGDYATDFGMLPGGFAKVFNDRRASEFFDLNMDSGEVYLEELFGRSSLSSLQKEILR
ncbi:MAG TPA: hypothetical protein VHK91_00290 [Flavisolibacter sp.]|nr:hypothetical protein [Flavisolibacter sp.]